MAELGKKANKNCVLRKDCKYNDYYPGDEPCSICHFNANLDGTKHPIGYFFLADKDCELEDQLCLYFGDEKRYSGLLSD